MTWKDILKQDELQKAPFGRFRRNKTPSMSLMEHQKAEQVKLHMQDIVNHYSNDANFQKLNTFQIKTTKEQRLGSAGQPAKPGGLIWLMDEDAFGDIQFIAKHGIPALETLGYDAQKVGGNYPTAVIEVKKKS
jgi:hypothetical protein|tara:strand:- start:468 stop:866 length:399 start_codon:yes stop_codon:yes gene_type:complete